MKNNINLPQEILMQVEKPARYIGNEINMIEKDLSLVSTRVAFAFPDVYEIGMSHLGLQILYGFINRREECYCERVFAPWNDLEKVMRERKLSLFSLETYSPIKDFDFFFFTLQYEMSFTNIINMLDLSNITILREERGEDEPFILAGGPCAYNPEPLADIVDIFYIGEGEVSYDEFFDIYRQHKKDGGTKDEFLLKLLNVDGFYIPKFYDVDYNEDGTIKNFTPNHPLAKQKIRKVIVNDIDKVFYPEKQLVPLIETVHDRVTLEVFRGCLRGCRFCQAGYVYRPVREKEFSTLIEQSKKLVENSGHEEISLVSLSTGDYSQFENLANGLIDHFESESVSLSLPSLRIDAFNLELMEKVQKVRKSGLTFAPEAGTQRLRDVVNKNISEDEILNGCYLAFTGGWNRVKLYFMTGLPTETEDDLKGIGELADKIVGKYFELPKENRNRGVNVVVSTSCFVPKAFTPFQWFPQNTVEEFIEKHHKVRASIGRKQIRYNHHDAKVSVIEGAVARGDRRVGAAIIKAWQLGARFDGWSEHFNYERWLQAFEEVGLNIAFYASRERTFEEILPWDHIDIGVSKKFLWEELQKAIIPVPQTTVDCRTKCSNCGATCFEGGVCFEK